MHSNIEKPCREQVNAANFFKIDRKDTFLLTTSDWKGLENLKPTN